MNKKALIKKASISANVTLSIRKRYRIKKAEEESQPQYWGSDIDDKPSLLKGWRNKALHNDFFFEDGNYPQAGLWGAGIGGIVGALINGARGKNLLSGALMGAGIGAGIGAGGKYLSDKWIKPKMLEGWQRDVKHDSALKYPEKGEPIFEENGRDYHYNEPTPSIPIPPPAVSPSPESAIHSSGVPIAPVTTSAVSYPMVTTLPVGEEITPEPMPGIAPSAKTISKPKPKTTPRKPAPTEPSNADKPEDVLDGKAMIGPDGTVIPVPTDPVPVTRAIAPTDSPVEPLVDLSQLDNLTDDEVGLLYPGGVLPESVKQERKQPPLTLENQSVNEDFIPIDLNAPNPIYDTNTENKGDLDVKGINPLEQSPTDNATVNTYTNIANNPVDVTDYEINPKDTLSHIKTRFAWADRLLKEEQELKAKLEREGKNTYLPPPIQDKYNDARRVWNTLYPVATRPGVPTPADPSTRPSAKPIQPPTDNYSVASKDFMPQEVGLLQWAEDELLREQELKNKGIPINPIDEKMFEDARRIYAEAREAIQKAMYNDAISKIPPPEPNALENKRPYFDTANTDY